MPKSKRAKFLFFLILLDIVLLSFAGVFFYQKSQLENLVSVKKTSTKKITKPTATPTVVPVATVSAQPTKIVLNKSIYTIAILGDSMVDTMGENLPYLEKVLKNKYSKSVQYKLYNYGIGAQNVELGLARIGSALPYKERNFPPLTTLKPDILILGSFSYNPFFPHDKNRHWQGLTKLIQESRSISNSLYLLAEIAPLKEDFGKGPNGPNMILEEAVTHSNRIIEQLDGTIALSRSLNIPLIDSYTPTQVNGKHGMKGYVDGNDGIHPSASGHEFMAEKIVETIELP